MTDSTGKQAKPKARRVRFAVGADVGSTRYEQGDTAPLSVFPKATGQAWLDQGLIVEVDG
jgi:hypothetical protein